MKISALCLYASLASANLVLKRDSFNFGNTTTLNADNSSLTTTLSQTTTEVVTVYASTGNSQSTGAKTTVAVSDEEYSASATTEASTNEVASGVSTSSSSSSSSDSSSSSSSSTVDPTSTSIDYKKLYKSPNAIKPKVFIISMFTYETIWLQKLDFVHNITVPGLSPLFPTVHCVANYSICQFVTGESEINAAASVSALTLSPLFDLSKTYFLVAGIGGGEPDVVTLGSATFAEYSVQVALEYQIDSREVLPKYNWTTGYFPYGTNSPLAYPKEWYGSEIFRVNGKLRDRAFDLASKVQLSNGTSGNEEFRKLFNESQPASQPPSTVKCDVLTSDTYWTGTILSKYFQNLTSVMTNGTATYCSTAQEDNATLESMMRAHLFGFVDFGRIVILRTISDFARAPPKYADDAVNFFKNISQGGSYVAIENIYRAGLPFVNDVVVNWADLYEVNSFGSDNYLGDVFGTLGGKPTFGPGAITLPELA